MVHGKRAPAIKVGRTDRQLEVIASAEACFAARLARGPRRAEERLGFVRAFASGGTTQLELQGATSTEGARHVYVTQSGCSGT